MLSFFFFNDTATTEIYTLSLHDALPIYEGAEVLLALAQRRFSARAIDGGGEHVRHRLEEVRVVDRELATDRKSTRLNSSHLVISYAVFCLKKKNNIPRRTTTQIDAVLVS